MAGNSPVHTVAPKLWLLGMGIASCHSSELKNLEVGTTFLKNLCNPALQ